MSRKQAIGSAIYSALLFAPFGFWILGFIIALKALKSRDIAQFKREIKQMFYYNSQNT